jgi:hypothetical protein
MGNPARIALTMVEVQQQRLMVKETWWPDDFLISPETESAARICQLLAN